MSDFSGRILEAIDLAVDERHELQARRAAERRRVWIDCQAIRRPEIHDHEYEMHLVDLDTGRCIAVRNAWLQVHYLMDELKPVVRQRLIEQNRCGVHLTTATLPES